MTTSPFAPSDVLTAFSCRLDAPEPEDRLRPGTHLRVFGGLGGSFPLAPFLVAPVGVSAEGLDLRRSTSPDGVELADVSYLDRWWEFTVDVRINAPGGLAATLLDRRDRDVVTAEGELLQLFPGRYGRLRLDGSLEGIEFTRGTVNIDGFLDRVDPRTAALLSLPGDGLAEPFWYASYDNPESAVDRVRRGASQFLNRMDVPDGGLFRIPDGDQDEAEVDRLQQLLAEASGPVGSGPGVLRLLAGLIGDPTPPWAQTESLDLGTGEAGPGGDRKPQRAELPRLAALQLAALDPGLALYLGFADALPELGLDTRQQALGVLGVVAIDPALADPSSHLAGWLAAPSPAEDDVVERYLRGLDVYGLRGPAQDTMDRARDAGMIVRPVATATSPLPPWNRPRLPRPQLHDHRWQPSDGRSPSSRYRASFAFPGTDGVVLAAIGRTDGSGSVQPVNARLPTPFGDRGAPRTFGRETDPAQRARRDAGDRDPDVQGIVTPLAAAAVLADEDVPAGDGTVTYVFCASDVFGRFGDPADLDVGPPDRPLPPQPVLRHHLSVPDELPDPDGTGPISPGTVLLEVTVPGLDQLAAGSLPITTLWLDDEAHPVEPGVFRHRIDLDPVGPEQHTDLSLTAAFEDDAGRRSRPSTLAVTGYDRRPPKPLTTGFGLHWTSAPGPASDVELALTWRAAAKQAHRVYLIDQTGLRQANGKPLTEPVDGRPPSRALIADRGAKGFPTARERFRLLADDVVADGSGGAVLRAVLPRSLQTVQFLRIVPVDERGAEAPFDRCGLVPVAVPDTRRPPPPRLEGTVDPVTGHAHVVVVADALDVQALDAGELPRFRVRRAVARVDPVPHAEAPAPHAAFARPAEGGEGTLERAAAQTGSVAVYRGSYDSPHPLEPFVRYVYWADVRMPDEQRIVAADVVVPQVAALHPADEAAHPRPGSLYSPPLTLIRYPEPPAAPDLSQIAHEIRADDATVVLTFAAPPRAHAAAIGAYRLAVWYQLDGRAIVPATTVNGQPLPGGEWPRLGTEPLAVLLSPFGAVTDPAVAGHASRHRPLHLAYVDPAGRTGRIAQLHVQFPFILSPP